MSRDLVAILDPGPLTTIQDAGRPGFARYGVSSSGAADGASYRLANRLVGNDENMPALEATLGGLRLRSLAWNRVAITGAEAPVTVNSRVEATNCVLMLRPGDVLSVGMPVRGVRNYVGVAGELDVPRAFGSASTDTLGGIGPGRLRAGQRLAAVDGRAPDPAPIDFAVVEPLPAVVTLRFVWGPRDQLFERGSLAEFVESIYTTSAESNRVAVRLLGAPLLRREVSEILSEPMLAGSIEVPPDGQPIVLLRDHPTTGGYPVVGVVHPADLDILAQCMPGSPLRFIPVR